MAATAIGHMVMVGVMAMSPCTSRPPVTDDGGELTLRIVGVVLSLHIAGMYGIRPATGWLTDRLGRRPVILAGVVVLLIACGGTPGPPGSAPAAGGGPDAARARLVRNAVAGSTLLGDLRKCARPRGAERPHHGPAGALAGALSGAVVQWGGYAMSTLGGCPRDAAPGRARARPSAALEGAGAT